MKEKQSKLKVIKKRVRRKTLFFLILTLMANSFAWFVYTNIVSNSINTHVKSWKVNFSQDGTDLEDVIVFKVDSIYPGMPDFKDSIDIINDGESAATISYEINYIRIMDETYDLGTYTNDYLINVLASNYPFKITFDTSNDEITSGQTSVFSMNVNWPYESGNDALDTQWGKKSYDYKVSKPDVKQIEITVKIKASQKS